MPTILLFDLDGTLVSTGGAGRRAIERAFADLHGRDGACTHISFAGMTDRAIARAGLLALGHAPDEAAIARLLARYLDFLDDALAAAFAETAAGGRGFRVLPGVRELVDAAAAQPACAVGLGTGNLEEGARRKLVPCGLWERFGFGGFADDSEERAELIRAGARRGAERLDAPLAKCRVVVVGDTPKDVAAAAANGFESLAVGSGVHPFAELATVGATAVVASLADPAARRFLLG